MFDHFLSGSDRIFFNIGSSVKDDGLPPAITVAHTATVTITSHEWLDILIWNDNKRGMKRVLKIAKRKL